MYCSRDMLLKGVLNDKATSLDKSNILGILKNNKQTFLDQVYSTNEEYLEVKILLS